VRARKYALDSNLFIRAFREPTANAELQRFHLLFAPFEFLSAVVAQELIAGTRTKTDLRKLERHVLNVFVRLAPGRNPGQCCQSSCDAKDWSCVESRRRLGTTSSWRCRAVKRGSFSSPTTAEISLESRGLRASSSSSRGRLPAMGRIAIT